MNKNQVIDILETIQNMYHAKFKIDNPQKTVDAWFKILQDFDFDTINRNLTNYVSKNSFPPSVADLINMPEHKDKAILNAQETAELLKGYAEQPEADKKHVAAELERMRAILGIKRG